jgi:uncharacterized protein (DUF305 family)
MSRFAPILAAALLAASPALAQQGGHSSHGTTPGAAAQEPASTREFREANERMHRNMMQVPLTGNADRDFVQSMIPHHQGAVDMARIALRHTKDPEVRRLAETVITTQEAEIAKMQAMLARLPR